MLAERIYKRVIAKLQKRFKGPRIKRMVVVAGPRGSGKSSFLDCPKKWISPESMPSAFRPLFDCGLLELSLLELSRINWNVRGDLLLHCDIITSLVDVDDFSPEENTVEKFKSRYASSPLMKYIHTAREIHVVTLTLPREELLQRWSNREAKKEKLRYSHNHTHSIYAGKNNDSDALRAAYQAWHEFVVALSPKTHGALDVSGEEYRYHSEFSLDLVQ